MVLRLASLLAIAMVVPAQGAALFPTPLHLVRRIEEPAAQKTSVVEEFCEGNRVITVAMGGRLVTIADYGAQELTEISRDRHEYSMTPFAEIARATTGTGRLNDTQATTVASSEWHTRSLGLQTSVSGRPSDVYLLSRSSQSIEVAFDRTILLSRAALEVLIGASYPSAHGQEHDAMLRAANGAPASLPAGATASSRRDAEKTTGTDAEATKSQESFPHGAKGNGDRHATALMMASSSEEVFALPVEQTIVHSLEGASFTVRVSIIRVDAAVVPRELLVIEPGARQVPSRLTRLQRELAATEQLPSLKQP